MQKKRGRKPPRVWKSPVTLRKSLVVQPLYLKDDPFDELVISQRIVNGGALPAATNGSAELGCALPAVGCALPAVGCALPAVGCALPAVAGLILQSALVTA
jgi:hypothetical protein